MGAYVMLGGQSFGVAINSRIFLTLNPGLHLLIFGVEDHLKEEKFSSLYHK